MEASELDPIVEGVVLLVIDMQSSLLATADKEEKVLRRTEFAIKAAKLLGIRVVFSEQVPDKLGPTHPDLLVAAGGADSALAFEKSDFNAFAAPGFDRISSDLEDCHILVAGIETPICIYQSVLAGLANDYQITLLADCIGGRRPEDADAILRILAGAGANILPSESIFYSILASAEHPQFREFTKIVKDFS